VILVREMESYVSHFWKMKTGCKIFEKIQKDFLILCDFGELYYLDDSILL